MRKKKVEKKTPALGYRSFRKWTVPRLEAILDSVGALRKALESDAEGALLAQELLQYLRLMEEQRQPAKPKKRRGRPPKGTLAAPPAVVDAPATLARLATSAPPAAKPGKPLKLKRTA